MKYVSLKDFSLDYWEQIWAQHFKIERCLHEKMSPVLELLGWWINSICFKCLSEVSRSYAKLLTTTSISKKINIIRNIVLKLYLGQHHFPQKEKSLWGWKANQSGWRGEGSEGERQVLFRLVRSSFCHMWQMQIFIQPKDLSLRSINAVKKLKRA